MIEKIFYRSKTRADSSSEIEKLSASFQTSAQHCHHLTFRVFYILDAYSYRVLKLWRKYQHPVKITRCTFPFGAEIYLILSYISTSRLSCVVFVLRTSIVRCQYNKIITMLQYLLVLSCLYVTMYCLALEQTDTSVNVPLGKLKKLLLQILLLQYYYYNILS